MGEKMLREIVTKAVVSKGKIIGNQELNFEIVENSNKALGCWIINHKYLSVVENNRIYASGCYDVHIWCAKNDSNDTFLFKKTVDYKEEFNMENANFDRENSEYKIYCIEYPTCTNLQLIGNELKVTVKKGLAIDVVGESKLLVQVSENFPQEDNSLGINTNYLNK